MCRSDNQRIAARRGMNGGSDAHTAERDADAQWAHPHCIGQGTSEYNSNATCQRMSAKKTAGFCHPRIGHSKSHYRCATKTCDQRWVPQGDLNGGDHREHQKCEAGSNGEMTPLP
jgi:hypothetical protein